MAKGGLSRFVIFALNSDDHSAIYQVGADLLPDSTPAAAIEEAHALKVFDDTKSTSPNITFPQVETSFVQKISGYEFSRFITQYAAKDDSLSQTSSDNADDYREDGRPGYLETTSTTSNKPEDIVRDVLCIHYVQKEDGGGVHVRIFAGNLLGSSGSTTHSYDGIVEPTLAFRSRAFKGTSPLTLPTACFDATLVNVASPVEFDPYRAHFQDYAFSEPS
jgi:hypothetical protein